MPLGLGFEGLGFKVQGLGLAGLSQNDLLFRGVAGFGFVVVPNNRGKPKYLNPSGYQPKNVPSYGIFWCEGSHR